MPPVDARLHSLLLLVLCVGGCEAEAPAPPPKRTAAAIINGDPDHVRSAVVYLTGHGTCTGTLIRARVVLTAAHCVTGETTASLVVKFGEHGTTATRRVSEIVMDPDYDGTTARHDAALLRLTRDAPTPPIALPSAEDYVRIDETIRLVGYGRMVATVGGGIDRQTGKATIAEVNATEFRTVPSPSVGCYGDSGGPALIYVRGRATIVGVLSKTLGACSTGNWYTRVSGIRDSFIDRFLRGERVAEAMPCRDLPETGACSGNVLGYCADDFASEVDCASLGTSCVSDAGGATCADASDVGGCGDVTYRGECAGAMLSYCDNDELIEVDCAASGLTCSLVDEVIGFDCGPATDEVPLDPCAPSATCDDCTLEAGCGYCASNRSCISGTADGPSVGACAEWSWLPSDCSS